ncbi:protein O-GlcNAcase-like isoform X7 [Falco biarmicus]|uniref:protein O-GlcNAcase-like isoform X7 n=1 Tax=Falco biarmicus TaxID=345155 RepID=UPI0024BCAE4B|nr:protein O-GlcNAcase-like isoform X7 [Falco biarmicus]
MAGRPRFLCGVVEGFYGRPWSMEQRKLLFQWLKRWGLNCYMYAPKDELKHRLLWREPYTEHEAACMQSLIEAAQEQGVEFVFAISAGQDMVFSSAGDRLLLQQKLRQVAALGCHSFALLFDDIDPCMCQADRDVFPSLAQAQASVANEVYQELGQPSIFLFCPTEYCSSLCSPSPSQSCYLLTIGQELLPGIGVIWTGPKVVSQELSASLLKEVEGVLHRRPVIWDNLYANDYDCRRVFLGPYTGRAPGLMPRLHGLLLNPNCELQANFIPMHTLGSWFRSELGSCARSDHTGTEAAAALGDSQGPQEGSYSPQEALELALHDWVVEINRQALEPGRSPGHPSIRLKGGVRLQSGTAGGLGATPDPQPHDTVPSGEQPCSMAPGQRRRKVTSEPENGTGSRTFASSWQSPTGDGDQLATGSRASCEPSSALPSMAGSVQCTGTPVATKTLHSPGPTMCCSNGANTSQNLLIPTSDARTGGGSPPEPHSSIQPTASRADTPQTWPGPGACTSPGSQALLIDGARASPGPMAPLTPEEAGSIPMAPLTPKEASSSPTAPLTPEGAGSGPMVLLTPEEAESGPMVPLTPKEARSSPTAPPAAEEARSIPMALLTPKEARSSPTAPLAPEGAGAGPMVLLTPEEAGSGPMVPLTPKEARSSTTAPLTPEEAGSGPMVPLTPKEARSSTTAPVTPEEAGSGPMVPLTPKEARSSTTAPVTPEEAGSGPMVPLTPKEAGSGPMVPLTPKEARSSPMAPLTPKEARSSPTAPLTPEEAGSGPMVLLTPGETRSIPMTPLTLKEVRSSPVAPLTPEEARSIPTTPLTPKETRSIPMAPLTPEEARSSPTAPLTLEEVRMLVELFYLPYHHGLLAQQLLEHFRWLRANSFSVGVPSTAPDACGGTQWRNRAQSFQQLCAQTCHLHSRFVSSAGQALLYDLHPYLWDIRNMLLATSAFVLWLDGHLLCESDPKGTWGSCFGWCQSIAAPILLGGDAEPWVRRGGLFGELQALLPVGNSCDLFYHPPPLFPASQPYLLRPLLPLDKGELYRMCRESLDCDPKVAEILAAHPDLLGDRLLGSFLSLSPEYTFVLEDEAGPCGYAAGTLCAEGFLQQRDSSWLPAIRHKYPRDLGMGASALGQDTLEEALLFFNAEPPAVPLPVLQRFPSLVQLGMAPRVLDVGVSCSLAICLLSALRANGSRGVFCQVSDTDRQQLSFYSRLGFVALPVAWGSSPGTRLLGRLL